MTMLTAPHTFVPFTLLSQCNYRSEEYSAFRSMIEVDLKRFEWFPSIMRLVEIPRPLMKSVDVHYYIRDEYSGYETASILDMCWAAEDLSRIQGEKYYSRFVALDSSYCSPEGRFVPMMCIFNDAKLPILSMVQDDLDHFWEAQDHITFLIRERV